MTDKLQMTRKNAPGAGRPKTEGDRHNIKLPADVWDALGRNKSAKIIELVGLMRWIPAAESARPEINQVCFAACCYSGKSMVLRVRYAPGESEEGDWYSIEFGFSTAVTHWMPLPSAPA